MKMQMKTAPGTLFLCSILALSITFINGHRLHAQQPPSKATIAVLSHTDFLPDATGVYDKRSRHGHEKKPDFAESSGQQQTSDQAYNNVNRPQGHDPESVGLPEILADAILEQLSKSKRFVPVERKALRTSLLEQRFGKSLQASYLDRTLDKAILDMDKFEDGAGMATPHILDAAKYNDLLHDFKDLGSAAGAQYIVVGNLHMLGTREESKALPYSDSNRKITQKVGEARLRLRVIDTHSSTVKGAESLHVKVSSMILDDRSPQSDDFEFLDQVAREAAQKILDITFPARLLSVDPFVISRGAIDGVTAGDEYAIVREGQEIKEQSGEVIARLKTQVGLVRVTDVQETVAVVMPSEGQELLQGDLAVLKKATSAQTQTESGVPLQGVQAAPVNSLPRVAVGLIKVGSTAKTGEGADKHVPTFTDSIISRLVQSKRFTVIDRQEVDQFLDEQIAQYLAQNNDLPSTMGTLKGCDYMIIGSLQNFSMEENSIQIPGSSKIIEVLDGFSEGNLRLVDARSGDIMESRKIIVEEQLDIDTGEERLIAALADSFAAKVVATLLNAVYPIKVAAVSHDGTVYANRGDDGLLSSGAVLDVFRLGEVIKDPDTGVLLGKMETRIGQMQLTNVEDNRSQGKMLDGSLPQAGDLLKLVAAGNSTAVLSPQKAGESHTPIVTGSGVTKGKPTLALTRIMINEHQKGGDKTKKLKIQQNTLDILTDEIIDALAKTNRFTMMERSEIDTVIDEKIFVAMAKGGNIRDYLGELEGSDYVVVGKLIKFGFIQKKEKIPYTEETINSITGFAEGTLRVVDSHSSRIVASEEVRIKEKYKKLSLEEAHSKLVDLYATKTAAGIVERLYPKRILAVQPDGTIFINRGADGGIVVGSTFTVERPGEDLVDRDTKIIFGQAEMTIGSLQITSVESARSRAKMVSGAEPLEGDILRNMAPPEKPKQKPRKKVPW